MTVNDEASPTFSHTVVGKNSALFVSGAVTLRSPLRLQPKITAVYYDGKPMTEIKRGWWGRLLRRPRVWVITEDAP